MPSMSSIDPEDFKKVMRAVEIYKRRQWEQLIATGALDSKPPRQSTRRFGSANRFYLYGEAITTRDLPVRRLRLPTFTGRSSRISDEGRRTRVWL